MLSMSTKCRDAKKKKKIEKNIKIKERLFWQKRKETT